MGSTNLTPNYELSQFIGTDKPAWLQDYNGDMLKIDTGIAGAKTAADNAQSAADGAQGDATTALNDIANINTELGTIENTLSTATGNINTINSLIGNGTPTTTDQTIIGAINEINANLSDVENKIDDTYVTNNSNTIFASVAFDGVKTRAQVLEELRSNFLTYLSTLSINKKVKISTIKCGSWVTPVFDTFYDHDTSGSVQLEGSALGFSPSGHNQLTSLSIPANSSDILFKVAEISTGGTAVTDKTSEVATSGYATIEGIVYEKI